jgi:cell division protein FtsL
MLRFLNALLVLGLLVAAYFVYALEHDTRSGEREIGRLEAQIKDERENYKLLIAEWSMLTRPDRIEHLAAKHLDLRVTSPTQRIGVEDIETRLPSAQITAPGSQPDPIGDVLRALDQAQQ